MNLDALKLFTTRLDENHTDTNYVDSRGTKTQLSE